MKQYAKHFLSPQFIRFVTIGLSNTLISYLVFIGCYQPLRDWTFAATFAQIVGYSAGVVWSYYWNSRWTFNQTSSAQTKVFVRFVTSQIVFALLSAAALGLLVDRLDLHPTLSWIGVMGFITVANFLVSKLWVFKESN